VDQEIEILIVEDEVNLRRCLAKYLESKGLRVTLAGSLAEAEALLDQRGFSAVVLDVGLPDGDGLTLLRRTTAERALVITANPDRARFESCGVVHHLPKPLDLMEVRSAVEAMAAA
jgi:DNA-binding response OmpR family regulator